jgi:hypothetical protein
MDNLERRRAGVLQIFQPQQHRLACRLALEQHGDRLERAMVLELGASTSVLDRLEQPCEPGHKLHKGAGPAVGELTYRLGGQSGNAGSDRLEERLREERTFGLVAAGSGDHPAGRIHQTGQLRDQPALTGPGGPGHEHQSGTAGGGRCPSRPQAVQFLSSANQAAAKPARAGWSFPSDCDRLAAQDRQVQLGRLGSWVGAELLGQPLAEAFEGGQRRARRAGQLLRQHQRPLGRLIKRVVDHRSLRQVQASLRLAKRQRRGPGALPDPAQQPGPIPAGVIDPSSLGLVGEDLPSADQLQRATGSHRSKRCITGGKVRFRFFEEPGSFVQVHPAVGIAGPEVPTSSADDAVAANDPTQAAHQRRDVLLGPGRW